MHLKLSSTDSTGRSVHTPPPKSCEQLPAYLYQLPPAHPSNRPTDPREVDLPSTALKRNNSHPLNSFKVPGPPTTGAASQCLFVQCLVSPPRSLQPEISQHVHCKFSCLTSANPTFIALPSISAAHVQYLSEDLCTIS